MQKFNLELPFFPGLYESTLYNSDTSYWAIKNELEYYQDECGREELTEDDLDFDYDQYSKDIVDAFVEAWKNYAPEVVKSVVYTDMVSPRYYNFETDRIYADIELADDWKDVMRSFMDNNAEWLKQRIHDDWTSYDGFMSFMSNNFNDTRRDDEQPEYAWESDDYKSWYYHLFIKEDVRYISTMLGYMMYQENKNVRDDIIMSTLDGDVWPEGYVYVIADREKEKVSE